MHQHNSIPSFCQLFSPQSIFFKWFSPQYQFDKLIHHKNSLANNYHYKIVLTIWFTTKSFWPNQAFFIFTTKSVVKFVFSLVFSPQNHLIKYFHHKISSLSIFTTISVNQIFSSLNQVMKYMHHKICLIYLYTNQFFNYFFTTKSFFTNIFISADRKPYIHCQTSDIIKDILMPLLLKIFTW